MRVQREQAPLLTPSDEHIGHLMLGQMIKQLRESRGITQKNFAVALSTAQSNVSKLENAVLRADLRQVHKIADLLEASPQERRELLFQFRLTAQEPLSYQVIVTHGADKKQAEIRRYEEASSRIDQYEPTIIPGLLQVPDYMRDVMAEFLVPEKDIEEAVAARLLRQRILIKSDRKFHFILSETSLHTVPRNVPTQIEQLEALLIHMGRRNTKIGIIPGNRGTIPLAMTGFILFNSTFATAETTVAEQHIKDPTDVRVLVNLHLRLEKKALYAGDAQALVREAIRELDQTG